MTDKFGDDEFKNFMEDDRGSNDPESHGPECPRINEMSFIVSTLREKMRFIDGLFKESLIRYESMPAEDPLKEKLREYILDLMTQSTRTMEQLDYALIDDSDPGPGDEDGPPKDEES